jgi:hypothetical protein
MQVRTAGRAADLAQDSADIGILPAEDRLVPMMMDNVLVAYQVE